MPGATSPEVGVAGDGPASASQPVSVAGPAMTQPASDGAAAGSDRSPRIAPPDLASLIGARSGDKGGSANVGLFARSDEAWAWLREWLTTDRLRTLAPAETDGLAVHRYEFDNLLAVNFVIVGLLGRGVAQNSRQDTQAKSLGEFVRSRIIHEATMGQEQS